MRCRRRALPTELLVPAASLVTSSLALAETVPLPSWKDAPGAAGG